jgi:hypothetical protein
MVIPAKRLRWRFDQRRVGAVPQRRRGEYVWNRARAAYEAYRPLPYAGRVALFRCTVDDWPPRDRGWGNLARGGLEIHDLPGRHGEHLRGPLLEQLATKLSQMIRDTWDVAATEQRHPEPQHQLPA